MTMHHRLLCTMLLALSAGPRWAAADVRLPAVLGDHMVLQQNAEVTLWGWAYNGETVRIETSWGAKTQATANIRGEWKATIKTPQARSLERGIRREHISFAVPNENMVQIKDILIGEVWLCSGQSNMAMMLGPDYPAGNNDWYGEKSWKEEAARTNRPALRVFNIEKTASVVPQHDCKGALPDHITLPKNDAGLTPDVRAGWQPCTPETAPYISAVAYYFGVALQEKLGVPVGLVTGSVGASPIEAWISLDALRRLPGYGQATTAAHRASSAALFNGMIAPLTPMTIQGVIWYQGESNVGASTAAYAALLKTLIADWRAHFHRADLHFGVVQLASFGGPATVPVESGAAVVREAQAAVAAEVPGVGLTVAIDVGNGSIHPPNKREVGRRLALNALAKVYRLPVACSGPVYRAVAVEGSAIRLRFETMDGALVAKDGPLRQFSIAGADGKFVRADAVIDASTTRGDIVVSSPKVPNPAMVRYAWADNPAGCNLYNRAGLPASPFRSDRAPSQQR